jgi:hypothetical protein
MTAVAFGPEILARGFTAIPNDVLVDLELSVQARMTWMLLAKYAWQKGQAFPAQATLGQLLGGVTARSVHRYVEELERGGWVEVQQRGLGKTNRYVLTFPASLTGHERPDGPDMDVCSDQTQVSDEERPTEKKTQEKKKRAGARILSPAEEPIGFSEWLGYHERLTGRKVPGASTTGRSELARTFARLLAEGHSLEDLQGGDAGRVRGRVPAGAGLLRSGVGAAADEGGEVGGERSAGVGGACERAGGDGGLEPVR